MSSNEDASPDRAVADALRSTLEGVGGGPGNGYKTLVMLSGGIDSIAVLANVLSETEHEVHAHHIELSNRENRQLAENDAVSDVVDYCWRHLRDFSFSTSKSEFRISTRGYDLVIAMFHAALVCIASGRNVDFVMTGHYRTSDIRKQYGQQMLDSCFLKDSRKPRWIRPLDALPEDGNIKAAIYNSVSVTLAELGWSCRTPVPTVEGFRPCGSCYACRNLEKARSNNR
jgi:7-cyano-7-deazaguanine synthase in queuosine biosynthesis